VPLKGIANYNATGANLQKKNFVQHCHKVEALNNLYNNTFLKIKLQIFNISKHSLLLVKLF